MSANRTAAPFLAIIGLAAEPGAAEPAKTAGPTTLATPGCLRRAFSKRRSAAVCDPAPGPMTSTSVGASIPGANPADAAALARTASDDDGSSPISGDPSPTPRAAAAAIPSPATHATITSSATGLAVANRSSQRDGWAGLAG